MIRSELDYFFMPEDIKKRVCRMGIRKPRHHHSDHRAVVTVFRGRDGGRLASYRKERRQCPLRRPVGPLSQLETDFEDLKAAYQPIPRQERRYNA